jgi:poly-gamma-glutamate capsule biosynthesis protein CapA/YwtB (metallophosphatase superfamily)
VIWVSDNIFTLTATGDVLAHGRVYGGIKKKSGFNFDEQLENVKDLLGKTDVTVVNLETLIAGVEFGLASYPRFNAPVELGETLKNMGVNLFNLANNHILDHGVKGLNKSIENIEKLSVEYVGAYKDFEDQDRLRIVNKNGLRVCFVSFTRGTNDNKVPSDKPYVTNSLKEINDLAVFARMRRIKSKGLADVIVANVHFGEEYHLYPSAYQREFATSMADAGCDVIIGHHPHVLQPPEWIETSRGTKSFVAYSLGNFFTGQNGLHRQIGAVLQLGITKPDESYKGIEVVDPKMVLTFVSNENHRNYKIHKFQEWVKENEMIETDYGKFNALKAYEETIQRMKSYIADLDII